MSGASRVIPSVALPVGPGESQRLRRADVVIDGLEHAGESFELRVFINNPRATVETETTTQEGYAGSVYVYGYGLPAEELGTSPRLPVSRYVVATEPVRAAATEGDEATVTLVPAAFGESEPEPDLSRLRVSVLARE